MSGDRLPQDAPNTPEEWQREWRVLTERMLAEPTSWQAQRWRLHEWEYEPPVEFVRELLTLWYQAGAVYGALDERAREIENEAGFIFRPEAHPEWGRAVRAIDVLVSGEKSRRIREQLDRGLAVGCTERPAGRRRRRRVMPDPAARFEDARKALVAREQALSKMAVATEMGIDRGTLDGYIRDGLVPPYPWEALTPR